MRSRLSKNWWKIAKGFDQKTIDNEVLKIKSVASGISVSNDDSFNKVARVYFALKKMKEDNNWDSLAVQCWSQMQELYGSSSMLSLWLDGKRRWHSSFL